MAEQTAGKEAHVILAGSEQNKDLLYATGDLICHLGGSTMSTVI